MEDGIDPQIRQNFENGDNVKLPSLEQVMQLIEGMDGISEEERENIRLSILEQQAQAGEMLNNRIIANENLSASDYLVFVAMLTLIALVFVLFGYKLYKSLVDRDRKREEKLKSKKSKKTKAN